MTDLTGANVRMPASRRRAARGTLVSEAAHSVLDAQIRTEASVTGFLSAQQISLQNAGACLNEEPAFVDGPNSHDGLASSLRHLFDVFEKLAADPANFGRRHAVVRTAQRFATQFNQAVSRLHRLELDINASIREDVTRVNQTLNDIVCLNRLIAEAATEGGSTALLASQRASCLETLAGFINVTATDTFGGVHVRVGGAAMIAGVEAVDTVAAGADASGNIRVRTAKSQALLALAGGCIAGKTTVRDGALAVLQRQVNALATEIAGQVNKIYKTGRDLSGKGGRDFFVGSCALDIAVMREVGQDPAQLQAGRPGDLGQLAISPIPGLSGQTFADFYARALAEVRAALTSVNDNLMSSQAVGEMLARERSQVGETPVENRKGDLQCYQQACDGIANIMETLSGMKPVR